MKIRQLSNLQIASNFDLNLNKIKLFPSELVKFLEKTNKFEAFSRFFGSSNGIPFFSETVKRWVKFQCESRFYLSWCELRLLFIKFSHNQRCCFICTNVISGRIFSASLAVCQQCQRKLKLNTGEMENENLKM